MNNRSLILYLLGFIALSTCILYLTQFTGLNHDFSELITYTRLAYMGIDILILLKILHLIITADYRDLMKKMALTTIALFTLAIILEGVFMFIPYSHGAGGKDSLAARLWFSKYWEVNSLGYRDKELSADKDGDKFKIVIIGDSFVAGHGIKDPSKRFSDLLQEKLPNTYRVYNLGLNGADTQAEYAKLVQFPIKPNLIILAHHPNDIERVPRAESSFYQPHLGSETYMASILPVSIQKIFTKNSYLVNYFYWKFNPITSLDEEASIAGKEYFETEAGQTNHLSAYLNESMFKEHLQNLYQFVLLSREEGIPLALMLFPETWAGTLEFSETFASQPIQAFFQRQNIGVLNVYSVMKAIPIEQRIVNNNDAHPSELAHQKIADALYNFLSDSNLIK